MYGNVLKLEYIMISYNSNRRNVIVFIVTIKEKSYFQSSLFVLLNVLRDKSTQNHDFFNSEKHHSIN